MEEFGEGDVLRRMQREQERERRRIRDRERRQAMTQEQRERHLARRRRNYQLRRQRAANNNAAGFIPLPQPPQPQPFLESSAGEASTSDELQGVTTPLDHTALSHHGIALPHQGSSVHMENLAYKPANSARFRLNHIKRLARSLTSSIGDPAAATQQVPAELITKEDLSTADCGGAQKSLRLNCVKRLARSINCVPKEIESQKNHTSAQEGIQLLGNESSIASS
ncbi:hypothetical protein HN51_065108 [Arachis hypogaea]|uniref:Uncharacterized protein n=1 Tax=Arachis hypogaea TaxID=3818 RepID=A0A444ZD20_ARAHY|nr:uncharacterized protein LOC107637553 isoform X1 [Arachis ipaensis]XP_020976291.1 uncharacterized protein LOC107637553 isoform X1 [Arachis ipaensis]XP_020976292.1 uncharacterized protein LOC107637553 isoform X1 [Arachis ipaensis]XP_025646023.1 uncharacterized protein LOC112741312 isoform X1 [Arachis hypogaea]XP_025646024.1 uncharacterized protein LOC112741312 isoform X1 [Arachis hypogaea]XP_025646025.1 uncharacterized protein LOC112741312 isoform X1 [Arachis hypogaea]QHO06212.1 hypothetical